MANVKLVIEYDGSGFHGWQIQPGLRTVQGELHRILEMILHEPISTVHASGRTDSGVHARGQVVSFCVNQEPDLYKLTHSVSSILKNELSVVKASIVEDSFHPRKNALSKQYSYHILNRAAPPTIHYGYVWHIATLLDLDRMKREARSLVGIHDFTSFRGHDCQGRSPVKHVYESEVEVSGSEIIFRIVGKGFLKQMVRILLGTLVDMGKGGFPHETMLSLMEKKDRRLTGVTAPPYGLFLDWVKYPT